jgi:hypothetical protein
MGIDTAGDQDYPRPQQGGRMVGTTGCRRCRWRPSAEVLGFGQDRGRSENGGEKKRP